jgi:trehalose-6-phosphatase
VLRHVLDGLKQKMFTLPEAAQSLKPMYRVLKACAQDRDRIVVFQSERALASLDSLMREQLFFSESQLLGDDLPPLRIKR